MYKDNEYYDATRYESAADRKEVQKQKQLHEQAKLKNPELYCSTGALQSLPVNDWLQEQRLAYRPEYLFGDLWRPGEVSVLAGETGVGKSILAVQIAESIARGKMPFREPHHEIQLGPATPPVAKLFPRPGRQRVLYFDLETSPAKMSERYSCPSPIPGKLPVRYRFASWFERSGYGENIKVPDHFRGDLARFLRHSVELSIRYSEAKVIIIDDLAALEPSAPRSNGPARWLRRFRHLAAHSGRSILVLTHLKSFPPCLGRVAAAPGRRGGRNSPLPLSLTDLTLGRQIAQLADTVIAIGRTTFGPEYRYIKVLKSKNGPPLVRTESVSDRLSDNVSQPAQFSVLNSQLTAVRPEHSQFSILNSHFPHAPVLAFQIDRTAGFSNEPKRRTSTSTDSQLSIFSSQLAAVRPEHSQLSIFNSQLPPKPFLGFTYLGVSAEEDLIRDHTADALQAQRAHEQELKRLARRSTKAILTEAIIDGSYERYLKGE